MRARVKKDVKLLAIMVVVLSLFNLFSMQVILSQSRGNEIKTEFGDQALANQNMQQDVVSSDKGDDSKNGDSAVFNYVNNKLKSYGYDTINFGGSDSSQGSSSSGDSGTTTGSDDQSSDSSSDDGDTGSGDDGSSGGDDGSGEDGSGEDGFSGGGDDGSGGEVPPNEDGPPAESVGGKDLTFDLDFGFG
ncbi:MAG: hypothetical protein ABH864_03485 [archaeon]